MKKLTQFAWLHSAHLRNQIAVEVVVLLLFSLFMSPYGSMPVILRINPEYSVELCL